MHGVEKLNKPLQSTSSLFSKLGFLVARRSTNSNQISFALGQAGASLFRTGRWQTPRSLGVGSSGVVSIHGKATLGFHLFGILVLVHVLVTVAPQQGFGLEAQFLSQLALAATCLAEGHSAHASVAMKGRRSATVQLEAKL